MSAAAGVTVLGKFGDVDMMKFLGAAEGFRDAWDA